MKLLARTNLYYIFFSVITYFIVAGMFYFAIEYVIYRDVDKRLLVERRDFEQFIQTNGYWVESCYFVENKISLKPVSAGVGTVAMFKDTVLFDRYNHEQVPFRQYTFGKQIAGEFYNVSIRKSLIESNQLLTFITIVMLISLSAGLSLLFLFQRRTSKKMWQPFYESLSKAKSFDIIEGRGLKLKNQEIFEFNELNSSLNKMTDKISSDYQNLKEFTENASHEIQTPLALINSRVEGLIQAHEISDKHMSWIQDIHESTMRLSRLNHALLLLAKIENGQFYEKESIDLNSIIERKLQELQELFDMKSITVSFQQDESFSLQMHHALADILVTNLLNNAVRHNLPTAGTIRITANASQVIFENTGSPLTISPEELFKRFKKQNLSSGSLGLGLAIVKKICATHLLNIEYSVKDNLHFITLSRIDQQV